MDYQLLYTYSNYNGDVISVEGDFITAYCGDTGGQVIAMLTPLGDKAVALARAILTSAGNTGHEVISSQEIGAKNCPVYETPQELAQEIERLTNERDRLRIAWESARRGRAQAREQLDDARRYVRILEAQRADLRQEVRDTSDQALRAARALPALTERVTQIEKHLDITPESA